MLKGAQLLVLSLVVLLGLSCFLLLSGSCYSREEKARRQRGTVWCHNGDTLQPLRIQAGQMETTQIPNHKKLKAPMLGITRDRNYPRGQSVGPPGGQSLMGNSNTFQLSNSWIEHLCTWTNPMGIVSETSGDPHRPNLGLYRRMPRHTWQLRCFDAESRRCLFNWTRHITTRSIRLHSLSRIISHSSFAARKKSLATDRWKHFAAVLISIHRSKLGEKLGLTRSPAHSRT